MKRLYISFLVAFFAILAVVGIWSFLDQDATYSASEKRELATMPAFSGEALLDGSYIQNMEAYYTDTFPQREWFLERNQGLNSFYQYGGGDDGMVLIQGANSAAQGGESLADVEAALAQKPENQPAVTAKPQTQAPEVAPQPEQSQEETPAPAPKEEDPDLDLPDESAAVAVGAVLIVEQSAFDIPTGSESVMTSYADTVSGLAQALGEDTRTISLVTPNAAAFYSPESFHTGNHDQKAMIDFTYSKMSDQVTTVDAYSALRAHTDEYIYFRTDHHWTQLGAYYAYTAFCETFGKMPIPLDRFETGVYQNFVGSMYGFSAGHPKSQVLKDNPDTLTYYLPVVETHAKYYLDSTLQDGVPISVVYTKLQEEVSNKYLCYIGGDTPVCEITTDVPGPVAIVIKESYGNAFVPFLTSHYSKIYVVDPREFNYSGQPTMDLPAFAKEHEVDDVVVINYPFMINNTSYIDRLQELYDGQ